LPCPARFTHGFGFTFDGFGFPFATKVASMVSGRRTIRSARTVLAVSFRSQGAEGGRDADRPRSLGGARRAPRGRDLRWHDLRHTTAAPVPRTR
jgi:hypothetical protein